MLHVIIYKLPSEQLCLFSWTEATVNRFHCNEVFKVSKIGVEEMAGSPLPQNVLGYFVELRNTGQTFSILVIGEQGSGKTSLVSNVLGVEIAKEEEEDTSAISTFKGMVQGVSVTMYEVSGLSAEVEQH